MFKIELLLINFTYIHNTLNYFQDSKCLQNPSQMKAVRCPLLPTANSYCFVEYDEHSTIRGCMDNLRDEISCYDSQNCQLCLPAQDGGACNAFEFPSGRRQCLACSGDQCTSGSNNQTSAYCMKSGDQCVSMQMNGTWTNRVETFIHFEEMSIYYQKNFQSNKCLKSLLLSEKNNLNLRLLKPISLNLFVHILQVAS